jgi:hypothetical protein
LEEGVDNVHDLIDGEFCFLLIPVRDEIVERVIEVLSVDAILQFAGAIILKRVY